MDSGASGSFCPQCGSRTGASDRFCRACGAALDRPLAVTRAPTRLAVASVALALIMGVPLTTAAGARMAGAWKPDASVASSPSPSPRATSAARPATAPPTAPRPSPTPPSTPPPATATAASTNAPPTAPPTTAPRTTAPPTAPPPTLRPITPPPTPTLPPRSVLSFSLPTTMLFASETNRTGYYPPVPGSSGPTGVSPGVYICDPPDCHVASDIRNPTGGVPPYTFVFAASGTGFIEIDGLSYYVWPSGLFQVGDTAHRTRTGRAATLEICAIDSVGSRACRSTSVAFTSRR